MTRLRSLWTGEAIDRAGVVLLLAGVSLQLLAIVAACVWGWS